MLITKLIEWWRGNGCDVIGHDWKETYYNGYMITVEEKCVRCGIYRHHFLEDNNGIGEDIDWREGKHPNRPHDHDGSLDFMDCEKTGHDFEPGWERYTPCNTPYCDGVYTRYCMKCDEYISECQCGANNGSRVDYDEV